MAILGFFRRGGRIAWTLILAVVLLLGVTTVTLANTMRVRYERDVTRMVFNDNLDLLDDVRKSVGMKVDSLGQVLEKAPELPADSSYLVVSIGENRIWYKQGDRVLFTTRVATGSGKVLEKTGQGGEQWKFETPRGRLLVQSKETDPAWVPPDWHFVEQAKKRRLGLLKMTRGQQIATADGAVVTTSGNDIVKRLPDGTEEVLEADDGREIVVNGNIVVPPFGTNQRRYEGVLGTHRLNLGDGYALHGTNRPETIGRSVSHGCVRLRNEDIETLYRMVPVGTPVYIY
jgi:hypothetical protein